MSEDASHINASIAERLIQALAAHEQGQLDKAADIYKGILLEAPKHADALHLLGLVAFQKNEFTDAEKYILQALTFNQDPSYYANLGTLKKSQGDLESADKAYKQALKRDDNHYEAHVNLAHTLLKLNKLNEATLHYEKALLIKSNCPETFLNLGHAYTLQGNLQRAEQCFLNALQLHPQFAEVYHRLGLVYLLKNQSDHAIAHFQKAIAIYPNFLEAHRELSQLFKIQRKLQEAKHHAKEALRWAKDDVTLLSHYASILIDLGEKDTARKILQKAKFIDEKNPDIHLALGLLWQEDEEHLLALSELQKASEFAPKIGEIHYHLARSHEILGKIKLAFIHYQTAIKLNPHYLNSYAAAAKIQIQNRDFNAAESLLKLAYQQDPMHLETLLTLFEWTQLTHDFKKQSEITGALIQAVQKAYGSGIPIQAYRIKNLPIATELKIKCFEAYAKHVKIIAGKSPFTQYVEMDNRIKIGYVSSHLDDDEDGLLLRSILSFHHRKHFEIFLYNVGPNTKKVSEKLIRSADFYRDLSTFNDRDAANRIHADGILYLIDLSCLRQYARPGIFALAPAPLQLRAACDLPYFEDPSIQLWLMPQSNPCENHHKGRLTFNGPKSVTLPFTQTDEVLHPADFGLPDDHFIYCYHGPMWRVDKLTFSTWLEILTKAPKAVLWLNANHSLQAHNLKKLAKKANIDPNRIILSPVETITQRLRHQIADVWLEPFTGENALSYLAAVWCALPTIRLHSKESECDAISKAEYIEKAISFYENTSVLDAARGALLKARFKSTYFRPDIYIDALEQTFLSINTRLLWSET